MWFSSAYAKQSCETGHVAQIFCAADTPIPSRGKKASHGRSLHFPWVIHSVFIVRLRFLGKTTSRISSCVDESGTVRAKGPLCADQVCGAACVKRRLLPLHWANMTIPRRTIISTACR